MDNNRALFLSQDGPMPSSLRKQIEHEGVLLEEVRDSQTAHQEIRQNQYRFVLARSERVLESQIDLLRLLKKFNLTTPVIVSTQVATIDEAERAAREGAIDVVIAPMSDARLFDTIKRVLQQSQNSEKTISTHILQRTDPPPVISVPIGSSLQEMEWMLIQQTLASVGNNKSKAARILGVSRKTLHNKLQSYAVQPPVSGVGFSPS